MALAPPETLPETSLLTPTTATVDLGALRYNARLIQQRAAPADLMAVVKADAYGHGAADVARALRAEGVEHFAVARVPEAIELREAGIEAPIQVFEAAPPEHLPAYARYDLDVTVSSEAIAEAVLDMAQREESLRMGAPLRAHVKVESGMHRIGEAPATAARLARRLRRADGVEVAGLWTHFVAADDPEQRAFTEEQLRILKETAEAVGPIAGRVHIANTPGLLHFPESLRALQPTFARCGLALYGLADLPPDPLTNGHAEARANGERANGERANGERTDGQVQGLRAVMRLTSRITHLKTIDAGATVSYGRTWTAPERTRLATVGAGYGDGYARLLSNRAEVGIGGRRFPVVGRICMDLMMVSLGPPESAPPAELGDVVVLFGVGGPSAQEIAQWSETIPYEVTTRVAGRVPRIYNE